MSVIDGIDYGPLAPLVGTWKGDKGMDIAPEPDGPEENPFYETLMFEPIGDVDNADDQVLVALRYHQVVSRKSNDEVFHNETGYWMWDARDSVLMQSLTIPRGVCLLAGATLDDSWKSEGPLSLEVAAKKGDADWGIIESPYMQKNARTLEFVHNITVDGDTLKYFEKTVLAIYKNRFDHTDENTLTRVS